jgi:hypothetical protein
VSSDLINAVANGDGGNVEEAALTRLMSVGFGSDHAQNGRGAHSLWLCVVPDPNKTSGDPP